MSGGGWALQTTALLCDLDFWGPAEVMNPLSKTPDEHRPGAEWAAGTPVIPITRASVEIFGRVWGKRDLLPLWLE